MPYNRKVIPSADKPYVSPLAMSSEMKKLSSFPVAFNGSYTGRTSPVVDVVYYYLVYYYYLVLLLLLVLLILLFEYYYYNSGY